MDQFFSQFMLLPESIMTLIAYLLIIIGGVTASRLMKIEFEVRRVTYLWLMAGLAAFTALTTLMWLLAEPAAQAGLLFLLIIAILATYVAFGAAWYAACAARSRHICGSTSKAWLGFVPIAVLWLVFAPKEKSQKAEAKRPLAMRVVIDPLLVIGALLVVGLSQASLKAIENSAAQSDSPNLREALTGSMGVEERFSFEANAAQSNLPVVLDEVTTLNEIVADGKTLSFVYEVSEPITDLDPAFESSLAAEQCTSEAFLEELQNGGIIVFDYRDQSGERIGAVEISIGDCA